MKTSQNDGNNYVLNVSFCVYVCVFFISYSLSPVYCRPMCKTSDN